MAKGETVTSSMKWSGGAKGIEMDAILLAPVPITQDKLDLVIDAGWVKKGVVCQGVSGSVAACK